MSTPASYQHDNRNAWKRRIISIPLFLLTGVLVIATLPLTLTLTAFRDVVQKSNGSSSRVILFFAWYFFCEMWGMAISLLLWMASFALKKEAYLNGHFHLQRLWGYSLFRASQILFSYQVDAVNTECARSGPYLLFVRHASVVDTVLASSLLSMPYHVQHRYVLKAELLWDPCLDLVGNRLPNAFVRRGSKNTERELDRVRSLAADMPSHQGILIYPEGTRFTEKKKSKLLKRLSEKEDTELYDYAKSLQYVLPPKLGGPLALLETLPHTDVVFFAHTGFEHIHTLWDLWNGKLIGQKVKAELWRVPAAEIPKEPGAQKDWLLAQWKKVDEWVGKHTDAAKTADPSSGQRETKKK